MENATQKKTPPKTEKVGSGGLTKKERRALKLQEKRQQEAASKANNKSSQQNSVTNGEVVVNGQDTDKADKQVAVTEKVAAEGKKPSGELTEKEKRRLEWEKKLAEQKQQSQNKGEEKLSKAQLKAKRRELQEAQRMAKQNPQPVEEPVAQEEEKEQEEADQAEMSENAEEEVKEKKGKGKAVVKKAKPKYPGLVFVKELKKHEFESDIYYDGVHKEFVRFAYQYSRKQILTSNEQCVGLLTALLQLVQNLEPEEDEEFCRVLQAKLQKSVSFLEHCRPMSVAMINVLRQFRIKMQQSLTLPEDDKKDFIIQGILTFFKNEILRARQAISLTVKEKICDGDVILTYACSTIVQRILVDVHKSNKKFRVIVVDDARLLEGRRMLKELEESGVQCTYGDISCLGLLMKSATKVLLGAHGLLNNGNVMARLGTAPIALVANAFSVPVLVCCETYKFSDISITNSLCSQNVIDAADEMECCSESGGFGYSIHENSNLRFLNLLFDVTPSELVTAIVTELAILPCSSVPAVLQHKPTEFSY